MDPSPHETPPTPGPSRYSGRADPLTKCVEGRGLKISVARSVSGAFTRSLPSPEFWLRKGGWGYYRG